MVQVLIVGTVVFTAFSNIGNSLEKEEGSILFAYLAGGIGGGEIVEEGGQLSGNYNHNLVAVAPLEGSDFSSQEEEVSLMTTIGGTSLIASTNPLTFVSQTARQQIITYQVEEGDVPSTIAASFGISTQSLLWANNLSERDYIRPGDKLTVPPVSGVIHKVKSGETVSGIAGKYKADVSKIISFNSLPANGQIQNGQTLIIPDGVITPVAPQPRTYAVVTSYQSGNKSHSFPWGYCTWYVAQKRYVPWAGHAKSWLANARAFGFATGSVPQAGAIVATREGGWWGHVAYVEAVKGDKIVISEMNHIGFGIKSVRVLSIYSRLIRGYIY